MSIIKTMSNNANISQILKNGFLLFFIVLWFLLPISGCNKIKNVKPVVDDIAIPASPEAVTQNHVNQKKYTWLLRHTVETYKRLFDDKTGPSDSVIAFLDNVSRAESGVDRNPDWAALEEQGRKLINTEDYNQLVSLWYGRVLFQAGEPEEAKNTLLHAFRDDGMQLTFINCFYVVSTLAEISYQQKGNVRCSDEMWRDMSFKCLAQAVVTDEFAEDEVPIAYHLLEDMEYETHDNGGIWEDFLGVYTREKNINKYLLALVTARMEVVEGWKKRGGGLANTVTEDGWKGFKYHFERARDALTPAWEEHPGWPEAPALMIEIAKAGYATPGETEEIWFNRALVAQFDYHPAYKKYLHSLLPRWGGTHESMMELGRKSLQTKRFDTDVPMYYLYALREVGGRSDNDVWRLIFREKDVRETLDYLFAEMLKEPSRADDRERILAQQALTVLWQGDYEKAQEMLASVSKDLDLFRGFAGKTLSWGLRSRKNIDTELRVFTGPHKDLLKKAEQHQWNGEIKEAIFLFQEIYDAYKKDNEAQNYLRERIAMLMMGGDAIPGHMSALHKAAGNDEYRDALTFLIESDADLNVQDKYGKSPLHYLPGGRTYKSTDKAKILLENGADINIRNKSSDTPLLEAIVVKDVELPYFL